MNAGLKNYNLRSRNTFGLEAVAREFHRISSVEELVGIYQRNRNRPPFILGGGSNVLLPEFLDRLVVSLDFKDWEIIDDQRTHVLLRVGAGWNWHEFVLSAIDADLGGMENLSLIPGTVGAAPIQNIGAYGVEIKDYIEEVGYFSFETANLQYYSARECAFDYRSSVFKYDLFGKGAITHVTFRLPKKGHYSFNTSYAPLAELADSTEDLNAQKISDWVVKIRQSKLPDPEIIGNAGSFFKNPIISKEFYENLKKSFKTIPAYSISEKLVKIPAAWLIDFCGWKGKRRGDVGCYGKQPLVIVNFGQARASELLAWADAIRDSIYQQFQIKLEAEVNILDSSGQRIEL